MDTNLTMKKKFCVHIVFLILSITMKVALAAWDKSEGSNGLPQLDVYTWPTQLFWLIITFTVGYILISAFVVPSISTVLESRSNKISNDLNKAKKYQEDAKNAFNTYESSLNNARVQAANAVSKAMEEAKLDTAKREAVVRKKLVANANKAEEKFSKIREESMESLNELAIDISQKIITDLTPIKVQKSVVKKYISAQSNFQN